MPTTIAPTREVTNLARLYTNEDNKFEGEAYNILLVKLKIFYGYYAIASIQSYQYYHALPIMLKDRAVTFYFVSIQDYSYNFENIILLLRTYFETDENRQLYITEWRVSTLQNVITSNLTKTRLECL